MVQITKKRANSISAPKIISTLLFICAICYWEGTKTLSEGGMLRSSSKTMVSALSPSRIQESGKPYIIYGTAWKKGETSRFVSEAVHAGFRFIDTACQPKHYNEAGVGDGWVSAAKDLGLNREDFSIQTKFTSVDGQDINNVPYDLEASIEDQVRQSLDVSLRNLKTDYIDSLVMHSPFRKMSDTIKAWRVFESFVDEGKVRQLGISNCYDINVFKNLYNEARIKPSVLQNRFYSDSNFDTELRQFCHDNGGILYQSFWTLTAHSNRRALQMPEVKQIAAAKDLTPSSLMYAFMLTLGHTPLSGTTDRLHMAENVAVMERIIGGETILNQEDINIISTALGIPNF